MSEVVTWKDAAGRSWNCIITVAEIRAARELAGVDLLKAIEGALFIKLGDDPVLLSDTLWAVTKKQAEAANVTKEEFEKGLVGDAIEPAGTALIEALINFSRTSQRDVLRRAWEKTKQTQNSVMEMAGKKLDSPEMDGAISRLLENASNEIDQQLNALGKSSTNSQESSESIQAP